MKGNMGYKEVVKNNAITLGGKDKKTGKANLESIEGYFLRTREAGPSRFNPKKMDYIHDLQTADGEVSVWGKVDMDGKLRKVRPGTLVTIETDGEIDTGKGNPMKKFKVMVDEDQTIEVLDTDWNSEEYQDEIDTGKGNPMKKFQDENDEGLDAEESLDAEEAPLDEHPPARTKPPVHAAQPASKASQAKTKGLLGNRKSA
jgi:hypothetical protein